MLNLSVLNSVLKKITPSKQLLGVIFFTNVSLLLVGQNLIINPSFENFTKPCKWDVNSYDNYEKFNGWMYSNDRWQFNANCFSQTTLDRGDPYLVKGKEPLHGSVAVSYLFNSCTKQKLLQLGFFPSSVEIMIGSLNDTLIPGEKYYFSYHLSPSYYTYYSEYPNGQRLADLPLASSNFVFSSLTSYETSQMMAGKYRYGPPNNGLPVPDYINPPNNFMNGNLDSSWNEVKGVFTADTFSTHFYFGSNGQWWREKMEGGYAYNIGIDYSDTVGIKNEVIYFIGYYTFDAFTLIPYPELGDTVALCNDQIILDPKTPKNRLVWFDGDTTSKTKTITKPGIYWVTAKTQFSSVTDTIVVLPNEKVNWPDTTAFCLGQKMELIVKNANGTPVWNNRDTTNNYQIHKNEQIEVSYINEQGCPTRLNTYAYIDSFALVKVDDTSLCETVNFSLKPKSYFAQSFCLNDNKFIDSIIIAKSGNYELKANGKYCKDSINFNITFEQIEPPFPKNKAFCFGDVVEFTKQTKYTANRDIYIENLDHDTIIYYQWEQGVCGFLTDSIKIELEACNCKPFIPNAFTPNNNGINDEFKIVIPCPVVFFEFKVFNRWGQRLFETRNPNTALNQSSLPIGTYFYVFYYETEDGKSFSTSGNIDVLK